MIAIKIVGITILVVYLSIILIYMSKNSIKYTIKKVENIFVPLLLSVYLII